MDGKVESGCVRKCPSEGNQPKKNRWVFKPRQVILSFYVIFCLISVNAVTEFTNDVIGLQLVYFQMPDTTNAAEGQLQDIARIIQVGWSHQNKGKKAPKLIYSSFVI